MKPKRTIEELGKIEKALKDKYGEESILDPRQFWTKEKEEFYQIQLKEEIDRQRKNEENSEKVEKDGFLISKHLLTYKNRENCPVCSKYSVSSQDNVYLLKFECCNKCYVMYVEGREERWKQGWRPQNNNRNER